MKQKEREREKKKKTGQLLPTSYSTLFPVRDAFGVTTKRADVHVGRLLFIAGRRVVLLVWLTNPEVLWLSFPLGYYTSVTTKCSKCVYPTDTLENVNE